MRKQNYFGYHPIRELHFKKGDHVLIPRGTHVRTSRSFKANRVAARTYRVRVDHVLCGTEVQVGHVYPGNVFHEACWHWDVSTIEQTYGTTEIPSLWPAMKVRDKYVYLPISNPVVRWVGQGGYWCEADINDVESPP